MPPAVIDAGADFVTARLAVSGELAMSFVGSGSGSAPTTVAVLTSVPENVGEMARVS